ncbi:MAG: ISLre2 family transposase [Flexilinea sp.]
MTKTVIVSITVKAGNGKARETKIAVKSDEFESEVTEIKEKIAEEVGEAVLKEYERSLRNEEYRGGKILRTEKRTYTFQTWNLSFYRRIYQMADGSIRKPIDELLNFTKYCRRSQRASEQICVLAAEASYRKTAEINGYITHHQISASTVRREVKNMGGKLDTQDQEFLADDPGTISSPVLFGESDGIWLSLQHEKEKRAEVRVAVTYTGKKAISDKRKRLENKMVMTAIDVPVRVWEEQIREKIYSTYNLKAAKLLVIGGDGGKWVGNSFDLVGIPHTERVLDPFHVIRNIKKAFGNVIDTDSVIKDLYQHGFGSVEDVLQEATAKGTSGGKKDRKECLVYLRNHADEIVPLSKRNLPFFHLCSLGSMESNVGKLVAQRMKTRGCSWRKDGAKGMLAILRHQSELAQHVFRYKDIQISTQKKILKRYKQPSEYGTIPHGSFPILNSGKISSPYASLFKAIIDVDLPL